MKMLFDHLHVQCDIAIQYCHPINLRIRILQINMKCNNDFCQTDVSYEQIYKWYWYSMESMESRGSKLCMNIHVQWFMYIAHNIFEGVHFGKY